MTDNSRLLIVEDDLDLAEMLNAYFRVQGYDVETANWGEDAVNMALHDAPDLIVLDIRLPDIDGYEVCRRLRSHRRSQDIPIIFLTEKRDRVDRLAGLELGGVDYITKPFDIQELRLRVRNALIRASHASLVNPITNLAEGPAVDEKLADLVFNTDPWAILTVSVNGLEAFRERYGFVAADDVLRAISLMINNTVRETKREQDFVGNLSKHDFVIITESAHAGAIHERISLRLRQSVEYFYPLKDREQSAESDGQRLTFDVRQIGPHNGPFADLEALKNAVLDVPQGE